MGVFTIGAGIVFNTVSAVAALRRFTREGAMAKVGIEAYKLQADKANVSLRELIETMRVAKSSSPLQRDIALVNRSLRNFIDVVKEARTIYTKFFMDTSRGTHRGVGLRAPHVGGAVGAGRRALDTAYSGEEMYSELSGTLDKVGFSSSGFDFTNAIGGMIGMASSSENTRVTFDAMLGSAEKTAELMEKINQYADATPFVTSDISAASRRLLAITGQDVGMNERLFKDAANIAALRPGSKVEDTARGITSAAYGEFEILKGTYGIALNQAMFEGKGEKGSAEYVEAVITEIENQFAKKTGGRDLVGMLGQTLTGRLSTLEGNVESIGKTIGKALINGLGLKDMTDVGINAGKTLMDAFKFVFEGKGVDAVGTFLPHFGPGMWMDADGNSGPAAVLNGWEFVFNSPGAISIAVFVKDLIDYASMAKGYLVDLLKAAWNWFDKLNPKAQQAILWLGTFTALFGGGGGPLAAIGSVLSVLGVLTAAVLSPLWEFFTGAAVITIGSFAISIGMAASAVGFMVGVFMLLRNEGEGVKDTFVRIGTAIKDYAFLWFERLKSMIVGYYSEVLPQAKWAVLFLYEAFLKVKEPLRAFFDLWADQNSITTMETFTNIGRTMGWVMGKILAGAVYLAVAALETLGVVLTFFQPMFKHYISDWFQLGKAVLEFVSGTRSAGNTLKTVLFGFADIVLAPFYEIGARIMEFMADLYSKAADMYRSIPGIGGTLARPYEFMSYKLKSFAAEAREGLLATERLLKEGNEIKISADAPISVESSTKVDLFLDTDKVADGLAKNNARSRNSGRGGDPMTPEALGFVLEGGGARIRPVGLEEVAG